MTLSFSQKWKNGQPNFFIEKIWRGIYRPLDCFVLIHYEKGYKEKTGEDWEYSKDAVNPKIHTIREDKKGRWKVGDKIHFVVNNRSKKRFQFAPVKAVKSVQRIEINSRFGDASLELIIDDKIFAQYHYNYDEPKNLKGLVEFIRNGGFDGKDDVELITNFKNFFIDNPNDIFKGKIIHWTDCFY